MKAENTIVQIVKKGINVKVNFNSDIVSIEMGRGVLGLWVSTTMTLEEYQQLESEGLAKVLEKIEDRL